MVYSTNINQLLKDVPDTYDFLSLDVDGDDYWVFNALEKRPRVVILEYHCGISNQWPVVCKEGEGQINSYKDIPDGHINGYYGANLLAFYRLAKSKGYEFVSSLVDNAFFVCKEDFPKLGIEPISEERCINDYFNLHWYWGQANRDLENRQWIMV
jgi:hypothetical protein